MDEILQPPYFLVIQVVCQAENKPICVVYDAESLTKFALGLELTLLFSIHAETWLSG